MVGDTSFPPSWLVPQPRVGPTPSLLHGQFGCHPNPSSRQIASIVRRQGNTRVRCGHGGIRCARVPRGREGPSDHRAWSLGRGGGWGRSGWPWRRAVRPPRARSQSRWRQAIVLLRPCLVFKIFQNSMSHQILRHMHIKIKYI